MIYLRRNHSSVWRFVSRCVEANTLTKWGNYRNWSGLERVVVQDRHHSLDQHTIEAANALLLDDGFTNRVLRPCIRSLPANYAYGCFQQVHKGRVRHTGGHYDRQTSIDTAVTIALDVADLYLDSAGTGTTHEPLHLDDLAADLRALPHNMVSASVSERLYKTLVKMLERGAVRNKGTYDVYSMLDCMTSTKWVMGALSNITCGEATREGAFSFSSEYTSGADVVTVVTTALEDLCRTAPRLEPYGTGHDGHRELVTFLGACYLRPGFALAQDRDFVRTHLDAALAALEAYLTKPGWKNKSECRLLVAESTPILEELHAQQPGSVTPTLVAAMEDAARWISSKSEVCSS